MTPGAPRGDSPGGARPRDEGSVSEKAQAPEGSAPGGTPPPPPIDDGFDPKQWLAHTASDVRESFARTRLLISFGEYFNLFAAAPGRHVRSAAQYLRDVFDHFGTTTLSSPRGPLTRWRLFDAAWDGGKDALMGQEEVQAAAYRLVSNFAREGRTNRLILLPGPRGSAKSTFVAAIPRAMEHYSTLEEGALYRFNWIFPSQKLTKGGIGFSGGAFDAGPGASD